jgi:hypothetical protein
MLLPSGKTTPWASGMVNFFEAGSSLARMLTHLRINRPVAKTTARLVTDLPGWTLAGRVSHPLDDLSDFQQGFTFPSSCLTRISRSLPFRNFAVLRSPGAVLETFRSPSAFWAPPFVGYGFWGYAVSTLLRY